MSNTPLLDHQQASSHDPRADAGFEKLYPKFSGWRVVVMGGSRGIGRAVSVGFAERGACVAACARNQDALDTLGTALGALGRVSYLATCDVADVDAVPAFVSAAATGLGGVDVLVNCASAFASSDDEAGWSASVGVDLMGSVRAGHTVLPYLKASVHPSIHHQHVIDRGARNVRASGSLRGDKGSDRASD